ncbi:hypothetical protein D3C87_103250 [compost metagenome]
MKALILFVGLFVAFTANAADRKVGNVIVVERDIDNVYANCLQEMDKNKKDPSYFFSCAIKITKHSGEVLLNKGPGFRLRNDNCKVDSEFGNGKMIIMFATAKDLSTLEESKACLREAVNQNPDMVATVQTVE